MRLGHDMHASDGQKKPATNRFNDEIGIHPVVGATSATGQKTSALSRTSTPSRRMNQVAAGSVITHPAESICVQKISDVCWCNAKICRTRSQTSSQPRS